MIALLRLRGWTIRKRMEFARWRLRRQLKKHGPDSLVGAHAQMMIGLLTALIEQNKSIVITKPNPYRPRH